MARGLIMRGDVLVNDKPQTSPHVEVAAGDMVRIRNYQGSDVSRGAAKIRPVAEECGFDCTGKVALDLGVSTGGFTQVLLELGAARIYAVDVGYGVASDVIRKDPRVILLERTNARGLSQQHVPEPVERVVGDLSFISWDAVVPAVAGLMAENAKALLLVKPQFELAAMGLGENLEKGVVVDQAQVSDSILRLYNTWAGSSLAPVAVIPAAETGRTGNREYFVLLDRRLDVPALEDYAAMVSGAIARTNP